MADFVFETTELLHRRRPDKDYSMIFRLNHRCRAVG